MAANHRQKGGICILTNVLFMMILPYVTGFSDHPVFTDSSISSFNHLAVDTTGNVYVGAVNKIYQLSPDLEVKQSVQTGPDKNSKDNVNKVLLIDHASNHLITCGSAHGFCSVRHLNNISDVREVEEPIVAIDAEASTVAFLTQGTAMKQVMHVGTTFTPHPDDFITPAVSTRSLEDDRLFFYDKVGTKIYENSLSRNQYPISYVYGFSSEGFSYFLTTQLREGSDTYYSKLVRVCNNDEEYYSYTEIPITCSADGNKYNLAQAAFVGKAGSALAKELGINAQQEILFAAFSPSETSNSSKPSETSALCFYSLKDIRRKFTQNIQSCFKGLHSGPLNFLSPSTPCIATNLEIDEDFCGLSVNTPLGGEDAVDAVPVAIFNERLTAVVVPAMSDYTVVFAGTSHGHLKKILLQGTSASEYSDIIIDEGSKINKDLVFDAHQTHLYVMSERKVSKIKTYDCSARQGCAECLNARDPYCGWCRAENKCSIQSECQNDSDGTINWRQQISSSRNDTCTIIVFVSPPQLQRTVPTLFNLLIFELPDSDEQLYCVFRVLDHIITTLATRKIYGVDCDSPPIGYLPFIPTDRHQLTAKLTVRTSSHPDLASTNFMFIDCSSYTSCTDCASSSYPCEWCVNSDRCTHDGATYCRNDILVTGNSSSIDGPRSGSCLSFHSKSGNEILVPSGFTKAITVKAHIAEFAIQSKFVCEFIIEDQQFRVNAQLLADTIYCDQFEFTYTSPAPHITASLNILWGGSKKLDNPDNIHIVIYRCNLAENCGTCLTMPKKYQCGWCQGTNKCELQDNCKTPSVWFSQDKACPNPEIHSFMPQLGPWEGGTNVTIVGINLGRSISDIKSVDIAGTHCEPIPELYIKTKQIVCTAVGAGDDVPREGPITVNIAEYRGVSNASYSFVNPIIHFIQPIHGPQSGGTLLHITGEYLNVGNDIQVYIDDSPCHIVSTSRNKVDCKTSSSHTLKLGTLRMSFDNANRFLESPKFEYVEDPVILSVDTGMSSQKQPKGTPSGGTNIKVLGRNFQAIQFPQIYVYYNSKLFAAPCYKIDYDTELTCESPKIEGVVVSDAETPIELDYGFDMDGVGSVQRVSDKLGAFILYPDPVYARFEGVKQLKSDYLTIDGDYMDWVSTSEEIEVLIGDKHCVVTSLSRHQLTCVPPLLNELSADVDTYDVEVKVGRNLKYNIGKISYAKH